LTVNVWPPIVAVPVRALPEFAATLKVTVPFPLPLAPAATVTQAALLVAVHVHPAAVDTATLIPVAPAAATDWLVGLIDTVQVVPADPAWLTVNVVPPTSMLPIRPVVAALAATVNEMDPLLLPLGGDVIVIHGTWLVAVHAQPALVVIAALPGPPDEGIDADVGSSEMAQGGGGVGAGGSGVGAGGAPA
jgi:hypothetical protein